MKQLFSVITLLFLCCTGESVSQEVPHFKNYMFQHYILNPAGAGIDNSIKISALYKRLWEGFEGSPATIFSTVEVPVDNVHGSIGGLFMYDRLNSEKTIIAKATYTYRAYLRDSYLQFGLSGGYLSKQDEYSDQSNYMNINESFFTLDGGVLFKHESFFAGASVINAFEQEYKELDAIVNRSLNLTAGYKFRIKENLEGQPSMHVQHAEQKLYYAYSGLFYFHNYLWAGASYSTREEFSILMGFDFRAVTLAYSYNFASSETTRNFNSQEVLLSLDFSTHKKEKNLPME